MGVFNWGAVVILMVVRYLTYDSRSRLVTFHLTGMYNSNFTINNSTIGHRVYDRLYNMRASVPSLEFRGQPVLVAAVVNIEARVKSTQIELVTRRILFEGSLSSCWFMVTMDTLHVGASKSLIEFSVFLGDSAHDLVPGVVESKGKVSRIFVHVNRHVEGEVLDPCFRWLTRFTTKECTEWGIASGGVDSSAIGMGNQL